MSVPNLLAGKKGVILGVANKRSIAWGIAKSCYDAGAELAFSYQNERLKGKVEGLLSDWDNVHLAECDVADDASTDAFFAKVKEALGNIDFLVHAVAYAPREELEGEFLNTTREGFKVAHDISAYSLALVSRKAAELMPEETGGSIVTMSYFGAEKVVPKYNVMGVAKASLEASVRYLASDLGPRNIRVNAISAGPVNTLAARGISGFTEMLGHVRERAPLRRNTVPEEVGDSTLFLVSDLARGITGETIYVDNGYNIIGM